MHDRHSWNAGLLARRGAIAGGLAAIVVIVSASADAAGVQGMTGIVGRLQGLGRLDRVSVEQALGVRLAARPDAGNPYFDIWQGRGAAVDGIAISTIELREPKPGAGATGSALLNLTLGGACTSRREIEQRFGPLAQTSVPRGRSLDEQTVLSRQDRLGRLSFGFAERSPDCLRSITLAAG